MLDIEWKAEHAVRDDTLVQKLCRVLITILGDTPSIAASDASSDVRAGLSSPSPTKPGPKKPKPSLAQALHRPSLGLGFCL